jgi:hypothetical protein
MSLTIEEIRDAINAKELDDSGWDLRDELLATLDKLAEVRAEIGKLQLHCSRLESSSGPHIPVDDSVIPLLAALLCQSARGRHATKAMLAMLDGGASSLDQLNKHALSSLLWGAFVIPGTTLNAMREALSAEGGVR